MNENFLNIREHHFQALYEISKESYTIKVIDQLLSRIMDIAMKTLSAERGFIVLAKRDTEDLELVLARNISEASAQDLTKISTSVVRQVIEQKTGLLSYDAQEDPRFRQAQSVLLHHIRSVAAVPLRIKDKVIGAIYVDSQKKRQMFTEQSLEFLEAFANQAGIAIENARLYRSLERQNWALKRDVQKIFPFDEIIGESPAMKEVFRLMEKVARSDVTVLIEGESGTGKELVARAIHAHGPRREKPFVAQYCGALPETLLESELFGHKKGAFTGAIADKKGLFEIADGGTFFLDEIAEISMALQTELLRVLQNGEIKPVGDTRVKRVDVRIISATNKDLAQEVKKGRFREDLYYRLRVITINLPPLRQRGNDVKLLAEHFLQKFAPRYNPAIKSFSSKAMELLIRYPWPGNVRELENVVQAALVMADGPHIQPEHLMISTRPEISEENLNLKEIEKWAVSRALARFGGNRVQTAQALGVSVRWLQYRLKEWGL
ncbi:MAG: sigma 54-interacting transcriptional regulator [candidate division KSB1 bacterium]|nr:sigma 54-interacting transcriptional regulator [candidate division KSB1 bacterium]